MSFQVLIIWLLSISLICWLSCYIIVKLKLLKRKTDVRRKTLIVMGSGGHTREMLSIVSKLHPAIYTPRVYLVTNTDSFSHEKVQDLESIKSQNNEYSIIKISRSREVGQSWLSTIWTTLYSFIEALWVVFSQMPDFILCNGPGVCVPVCYSAFLFKILFFVRIKMMFVESICRTNSLSLSGKLLKYITDCNLVQWDTLMSQSTGRLTYIGRVA